MIAVFFVEPMPLLDHSGPDPPVDGENLQNCKNAPLQG
jgi:hypothetical protein